MNWFRRKRPAPPPAPRISAEDLRTAADWGLTPDQWAALSDETRAEKRLHRIYATHF